MVLIMLTIALALSLIIFFSKLLNVNALRILAFLLAATLIFSYITTPFFYIELLLIPLVVTIVKLFALKRNNAIKVTVETTSILSTQMENIPDTCPHCKNPNTKKIRLCEWCGNQIF